MYEDVCYRKSFLKQVIIRTDFAGKVSQLENSVPSKLLNAILEIFPIVEPEEILSEHEFTVHPKGVEARQKANIKQWKYFSKDRTSQFSICAQNFFASYSNYTTYEDAKAQFISLVDLIAKIAPDAKGSRFGLRYINQLDLEMRDPLDWSEYVNPLLIQNRTFFGEADSLSRVISVAEIAYPEVGIRFQYGMPNPDYPAAIKRPLFVLDFDASVSEAHDLKDIAGHMDAGHKRIQEIFERSITPALREKMNVRPVQQ